MRSTVGSRRPDAFRRSLLRDCDRKERRSLQRVAKQLEVLKAIVPAANSLKGQGQRRLRQVQIARLRIG